MRKTKGFLTLFLVFLLSVLSSVCVLAATSISQLDIMIDSSISEGTRSTAVSAGTESNRYYIKSCTVENLPSGDKTWEDTSQPSLKIVAELYDSKAYTWGAVSKSSVSVTGDPGDVSGSSAGVKGVSKSGKTVTVTYKMAPLGSSSEDSEYDLTVTDMSWEKESGTAAWSGADDAAYFQVKLYRGSTLLNTSTTSDASFCFAKYFTNSGNYKFTVQSFMNTKRKGAVVTSPVYTVTSAEAKVIKDEYADETSKSTNVYTGNNNQNATQNQLQSAVAGGPSGKPVGRWVQDGKGWRYVGGNGQYISSDWIFVDGKWYYLDGTGYMVTGWTSVNGNTYYFDIPNGHMWVSMTTPDGQRVDNEGRLINASVPAGTPESAMTNTVSPDAMPQTQASGAMPQTQVSGMFIQDQDGLKYLRADGSYAVSTFEDILGNRYYFDENGCMAKGFVYIGGIEYRFDENSGVLLSPLF